MFGEVVLKATIGLGDSGPGGALNVHRGVARMNRGNEGHTSAHEIGWGRHDEGEVAIISSATGRMNRPGVRKHLLLKRLEAGVVGGTNDDAQAWMRKRELGRRFGSDGAHGR